MLRTFHPGWGEIVMAILAIFYLIVLMALAFCKNVYKIWRRKDVER